jgi:transcription elongation factor SPT5
MCQAWVYSMLTIGFPLPIAYMGIVKDASETTVRVELHTSCKILSVKPSQVKVGCAWFECLHHLVLITVLTTPVKIIAANRQEHQAPGEAALQDNYLAAQTPLYGNATPMHGAAVRQAWA